MRSSYSIRLAGLANGSHEFTFWVKKDFFTEEELGLIRDADLKVLATLHKDALSMQLDLELQGSLVLECVRCLDDLPWPLQVKVHLIIRTVENPEAADDDTDTIHIAPGDHQLDLRRHIYDFISLQVPYSPVHPDREEGKPGCEGALGKIPDSPQSEEGQNPWSGLKNIRLN